MLVASTAQRALLNGVFKFFVAQVVLILGGMNDSTRFEQLQNAINGVLKNDVDNDGETESSHYRQLSNNIICNNVCFNR
ncbi:unnamed protein product [Adineta steineri]|uniref:Uncharacterized protein n=1 Tax=Adineta steineri TaxID=433720 RepID=A0A818WHP0_9BILA|nr:unnamed protein product [Adineta steineri]